MTQRDTTLTLGQMLDAAGRAATITHRVPLLTTLTSASAAVAGIRALRAKELKVRGLQEHYRIAGGP